MSPKISAFIFATTLLAGVASIGKCQVLAEWDYSIPVAVGNDPLTTAWAGGLNAVQYNTIMLNGDNQNDLLLFDRSSNTLHPFLRENNQWVYAPDYTVYFPSNLQSWVLLKDYDQDGDQDLFTASGGRGITVYRNDKSTDGILKWTLVTETLRTIAFASGATVTLQVNSSDYPAIADIDQDGDLDIINYSVIGSGTLILHENQSMEQFGRSDSLVYRTTHIRWGNFEECDCGLFAFGDQGCADLNGGSPNGRSQNGYSQQSINAKLEHVGGKSLLVLDADGDGDLDMLTGDEGCYGITLLENEPSSGEVNFRRAVTNYPKDAQPSSSIFFPGAYQADVNADGILDLMLSPNASINVGNSIDFASSSWWYQNQGSVQNPQWEWMTSAFLQEEMIDVGEDAVPALVDYDVDGDLDLFIGNRGKLRVNGFYAGLYLYENIGNAQQPSFQFKTSDFLELSQWKLQELKPYFSDINQDGKIDLLVSGRESASRETRLYALINQAEASAAPVEFQVDQRQLLTLPFRSEDNLAFYDINEDQRIDVLVGKQSGNLIYYRNQSADFPPSWLEEEDAFAGIERSARGLFLSPVITDTDSGGSGDILSTNVSGSLVRRSFNNEEAIRVDTISVRNALLLEAVPVQLGRQNWLAAGQLYGDETTSVVIGSQRGGVSILQLEGEGSTGEAVTLKVYPNPTEGLATVQASGGVNEVQIISVAGQTVYENVLTIPLRQFSIDLSVLPTGLYIMRAMLDRGAVASTKLIVSN